MSGTLRVWRGPGVRLSALLVSTLLASGLVPRSGDSHAFLVKSSPARRATLTQPPARILLWFNERLEPAYSSASVRNAAGVRVDRGDTAVGPEDPKLLSVGVPPLPPGAYSVRFRVLSVDGHIVESSVPFTITGGRESR